MQSQIRCKLLSIAEECIGTTLDLEHEGAEAIFLQTLLENSLETVRFIVSIEEEFDIDMEEHISYELFASFDSICTAVRRCLSNPNLESD